MDLSGGEEHRKQEGGREVWVDREREMEGRRKRQGYVERKFGRLRTNERERERRSSSISRKKKDSGSTKRQRKKRQTDNDPPVLAAPPVPACLPLLYPSIHACIYIHICNGYTYVYTCLPFFHPNIFSMQRISCL